MGNLKAETTLWPDFPLGIVSEGKTVEAFNLVDSSFRRPFTELGILEYTIQRTLSTARANIFSRAKAALYTVKVNPLLTEKVQPITM